MMNDVRAGAYFFRHGCHLAWQERYLFLAEQPLFLTILALWTYIWSMVTPEVFAHMSVTWTQLVWYLAISELAPFAVSNRFHDIEYQLRDGAFDSHLSRPLSWLRLFLAQEAGATMTTVLLFITSGFLFAGFVTGTMLLEIHGIPALVIKIILALLIWQVVLTCVGLTSLWAGSSKAAYWIVQKLGFIGGGMIIPLHLYPEWAQHVAYFTPFPAVFAVPAQTVLATGRLSDIEGISYQIIVLITLLTVLHFEWRAFTQKLLAGGS
jgi:ABC-2 type transport system permease protein